MAVTRIKNNQITDSTITGSKMVSNTITSGLLENNLTYSSNLTISGNLTVNGTTTTVDTTNTLIADPLFVLSRGETGTPSVDSGFIVERGTSDNVGFVWDESADVFAAIITTEDGTTAGNITISSYANAKVADIEASSASLGNIDISGNSITSTDTNGNITLTPNGTGDIDLQSDTVVVGDSNTNATVTTNGTGNLILNTNNGSGFSGSITIEDGANGGVTIAPAGTGTVNITNLVNSDLTSGRVILAGTGGVLEDSGNLTFDGTTLTVSGDAAIDNVTVDGNTISTSAGNLSISSAGGEVTASSLAVTDLTSGRVTFAGTSGALEDSSNLTWNGSLLDITGAADVSGNATVGGTFGVTGESTLASATVSDLTSGRVVLAGTAGAIEDSGNLTFNGSTLAVTGAVTVSTTLGVTGESTLASATVSDLTSGRVVLAGTSGAIEDSGNLTFDGTTLTVNGDAAIDNVTVDGNTISTSTGNLLLDSNGGEVTASSLAVTDLTSGRVVLAGTSGAIEDSGNLTFDGTTLTVNGDAAIDNVTIDGNTISTSAGNLSLDSTGGEVTASSLAVSDLTNNRVVIAGASGAIEDDANFTFDGSNLNLTAGMNITGDLDVDNLNVNGNDIISTNSNGNISITPDGTGEVIISTATVSDLTSGRVVLAGTSGAIEDSGNLTFDGTTLTVSGNVTVDNITIDGDTISSVHDTITIDPSTVGAGGTVVIAGNLQVTGTTTTVDSTIVTVADPVMQIGEDGSDDNLDRGIKALYNSGGAKVAFFGMDDTNQEFIYISDATDTSSVFTGSLGSAAFGSLRVTDLTDNRVLLAGTSGEIEDSGNLTFDGTTLTVTGAAAIDNVTIDGNTISTSTGNLNIDSNGNEVLIDSLTVNDLTSGRVILAGTDGAIEDSSNLTFDGTTLTVSGDAAIDNVTVDGNTISTSAGNLSLDSTGGEVTAASLAVSDLTATRVTFAGASGALVDSANMTFDGTDLTVASAKVSDLTSGRVILAGTSGAIEDSGNLTFNGTTLTVSGAADIDNINIDGNAITSTDTNGNISITPDGTGEVIISTATVSDLTSGRVVLAGTDGAIEDSSNLTFNGTTLAVTGAVTVSTTLGVTGESTLASATVSDLTSGRVVLAGTSGAIEDSGNLTFDGTTLTVSGDAAIDNVTVDGNTISTSAGNLSLDSTGGEVTTSSLAVTDLTSGRVVLAGTSGAIEDNGNLTFNGSTLAVTGATTISTTLGVTGESTLASATVSDLTSGRVVLAGTSGAIEDSGNLTFDGTTLTVSGAAAIDNVTIDGNSITSSDALTLDAAASQSIVVNESGADVDFRIESDTNTNAFFLEGSTGNIGFKTATPHSEATLTINSTDSIIVPVGGTGDRPASPVEGMTRFNTTTAKLEFYDGSEWIIAGSEFTIFVADDFAGDGSTVAFTISEDATSAGILVALNGVVQDPGTAYGVSGTTLTFTEAPASGDNIDVRIITTTASVTELADINTAITVNDSTETVTATIDGDVVMQVTNAAVIPGANVTYDLGTSSLRWKDLYLSGSSITLGGLVLKDNGSNVFGIFQSDGTTPATLSSSSVAANSVELGTDTTGNYVATITGTSNEIEVSGSGSETANVTIGLPNDVTIGNDLTVSNDLTVTGNFTVNGTTTTVSSTNTVVSDNLLELNNGVGSNANDSGLVIERGSTGDNAFIGWDESADKFIVGTTTATGSSTGNLTITAGTLVANIEGDVTGDLTGTASLATNVNVTANNTANETVYLTFVDGATGSQGIETDTNLSYNPSTNVLSTTASQAQYADLAEKYTADQTIEPGTVVCFGGTAEVTVCNNDMDRKIAGVVSTNPAYLMNSSLEAEYSVDLALQGRVPCKVIGPVSKGDMMVSAGNGHARAEENPSYGSVIGKAVEDFDGEIGVIEVLVGRM